MATDPVTIDVKVKTLNSQTHDFSVQNDITVRQFKEHIADTVNIQPDQQRIIYRGRILNDTVQLKEYDMHGKVVHLVERPPPVPGQEPSADNPQPNTTTGPSRRRVFLHRGANGQASAPGTAAGAGGPSLSLASTLCLNRITVARHMLQCASNIINHIENPETPLDNAPLDLLMQETLDTTVVEVGISSIGDVDQVQDIMHAVRGAVTAAFRPGGEAAGSAEPETEVDMNSSTGSSSSSASSLSLEFDGLMTPPENAQTEAQPAPSNEGQSHAGGSAAPNQSATSSTASGNNDPQTAATPGNNTNGRSQQTTSPRVLGEVVEEMRSVQRRLEPHLQRYYDILMTEPTYTAEETARRENDQRTFDRVSEALHYMSHAQHAISDLMLDLSSNTPRHLCCRPILIDHGAFVNTAMPTTDIVLAMGGMTGGPMGAGGAFQFAVPLNGDPPTAPPTTAAGNTPTAPPAPAPTAGGAPPSAAAGGTPRRVVHPAGIPRNIPPHHHHVATIPILVQQTTTNPNGGNPTMEQLQQSVAAAAAATIQSVGFNEILQSVLSVVPMATIELQHGNDPPVTINVPPAGQQPVSQAQPQAPTPAPATTGASTGDQNTDSTGSNGRVPFATTMPTTSTQTRSTARPQVHVTSFQQPTEIRGARSFQTSPFSSFDRFLPCNSHHIREQPSRQQGPVQGATGPTIATGVPPPSTPGTGNGMAGRVQGNVIRIPHPFNLPYMMSRPVVVSQSRSASRDRSAGGAGSRSVTPSDDLEPVYSSPDPEEAFVVQNRDALRQFVASHFFNGSEITVDNLREGVSEVVIALEDLLAPITSYDHPNICIRLSVLELLRSHLQEIMNLLRKDETDADAQAAEARFGGNMIRSIRLFANRLGGILLQSNQRRQDIRQLFRGIFNRHVKNMAPEPLGRLLKYALKVCLQTIDNKFGAVDMSTLTPYLVYKTPSPDEASPMEVEESDLGAASMAHSQEVQMDAQPSTSAMAPPSATTTTATASTHRNLLTRLRCESECEDYPEANASAPWHANVPAAWVSSLAHDVEEQKKINDSRAQPMSDAYLESMSKKRRKTITETRPTGTVAETISAGVRHVIQNSGFQTSIPADQIAQQISGDVGLQGSYRESLNTSIRDRLRTDPNYDAAKYPNAGKYFK